MKPPLHSRSTCRGTAHSPHEWEARRGCGVSLEKPGSRRSQPVSWCDSMKNEGVIISHSKKTFDLWSRDDDGGSNGAVHNVARWCRVLFKPPVLIFIMNDHHYKAHLN